MSDTRQVLEEAFKVIHPEPSREWEAWDNARIAEQREEDKASFMRWNDWRVGKQARFTRLLDAEAWTDAALCLVPLNCQCVVTIFDDGEGEVILTDNDGRDIERTAAIPALAIAQAALRAKEAGDV